MAGGYDLLVVLIVFIAIAALYIYRYWKYFKYLRWKLRVIPLVEQRERWLAGLCIKCGYNMRGTRERCPECGTIPVKAKTSK